LWVNAANLTNKQVMLGNYPGSSNNGAGMEISTSLLNFYIFYNSTSGTSITVGAPTIGSPMHVAATLSGTAMALYRNGQLLGTATLGGAGIAQSANISLAYYASNSSDWFQGTIYQARVYSVGLTATQVAQNFNATRRLFGV
jgi:hypothetical protein